jgi:putative phage-type endonuclease
MEQRSAEWHELRKNHIGASDASSVLGVSPWKTAYELWEEKMGKGVKQPFTNPYMQRGIDLEPEALRAFENATGYLMRPMVLISPKHQFMMASLDGLEIEDKCAVEIKAPGKKDHECALDGQIPEKYIPQLQHQISVTGLAKIYYFSYSPESNKILEVYRDQDYIDKMIEKEAHFYYEHMVKGIPPSNDHQINTIESEQWINVTNELKKIRAKNKAAKKEIEENEKLEEDITQLLLQMSCGQNAQGNGITLQKIERKGIIPYSTIPMLKQMDLEKFRKPPSSSWRITESNND